MMEQEACLQSVASLACIASTGATEQLPLASLPPICRRSSLPDPLSVYQMPISPYRLLSAVGLRPITASVCSLTHGANLALEALSMEQGKEG